MDEANSLGTFFWVGNRSMILSHLATGNWYSFTFFGNPQTKRRFEWKNISIINHYQPLLTTITIHCGFSIANCLMKPDLIHLSHHSKRSWMQDEIWTVHPARRRRQTTRVPLNQRQFLLESMTFRYSTGYICSCCIYHNSI